MQPSSDDETYLSFLAKENSGCLMKRTIFSAMVTIFVMIGVSSAVGQTSESYYGRSQYVAPTPAWNYPRFGHDNYGSHASTYEAGVLRGMGNLYRGAGEYNVANSMAAYNWQLARMASLQNNILERNARAAVYASVRRGQERRHQENIKKNQAVAAFHARENGAVLAASQFDRKTGEVKWPNALLAAEFDQDRASIENAIDEMSDTRQVSVSQSTEDFAQAIKTLRAKLIDRKDEFRPSEYAYAKSFLDRLSNATRIDTKSLALNF